MDILLNFYLTEILQRIQMSDLVEALNRILSWLQLQKLQHPQATEDWWIRSPEEENNAPFLKPGLSSAEIAEITQDIQDDFPPDSRLG